MAAPGSNYFRVNYQSHTRAPDYLGAAQSVNPIDWAGAAARGIGMADELMNSSLNRDRTRQSMRHAEDMHAPTLRLTNAQATLTEVQGDLAAQTVDAKVREVTETARGLQLTNDLSERLAPLTVRGAELANARNEQIIGLNADALALLNATRDLRMRAATSDAQRDQILSEHAVQVAQAHTAALNYQHLRDMAEGAVRQAEAQLKLQGAERAIQDADIDAQRVFLEATPGINAMSNHLSTGNYRAASEIFNRLRPRLGDGVGEDTMSVKQRAALAEKLFRMPGPVITDVDGTKHQPNAWEWLDHQMRAEAGEEPAWPWEVNRINQERAEMIALENQFGKEAAPIVRRMMQQAASIAAHSEFAQVLIDRGESAFDNVDPEFMPPGFREAVAAAREIKALDAEAKAAEQLLRLNALETPWELTRGTLAGVDAKTIIDSKTLPTGTMSRTYGAAAKLAVQNPEAAGIQHPLITQGFRELAEDVSNLPRVLGHLSSSAQTPGGDAWGSPKGQMPGQTLEQSMIHRYGTRATKAAQELDRIDQEYRKAKDPVAKLQLAEQANEVYAKLYKAAMERAKNNLMRQPGMDDRTAQAMLDSASLPNLVTAASTSREERANVLSQDPNFRRFMQSQNPLNNLTAE
jgi:hypothetical protein